MLCKLEYHSYKKELGSPVLCKVSCTIPSPKSIEPIVAVSNQVVNVIKSLKTWIILKGTSSFYKSVRGFD